MLEEDFTEDTGRPSKTKKKQEMHELRDLGEELVELSVGQLKAINLPENIFEAVRECQKITAHGAHRRQVMYLGKLMRGVDDEHLGVVTDQPHVVVDLPRATVELEHPGGDNPIDSHAAGRRGQAQLTHVTRP